MPSLQGLRQRFRTLTSPRLLSNSSASSTLPRSEVDLQLDSRNGSLRKQTTDWLRYIQTPVRSGKHSIDPSPHNGRITKRSLTKLGMRKSPDSSSRGRHHSWDLKTISRIFYDVKDGKDSLELEGNIKVEDESQAWEGSSTLIDDKYGTSLTEIENDNVSIDEYGSNTLIDNRYGTSSTEGGNDTVSIDEHTMIKAKNSANLDSNAPLITMAWYKELDEDALKDQGWTDDEIWLYQKINMRGYEPLLPESWALDFPAFPKELFSAKDSAVFVKAFKNDYHAVKQLESLILLGSRIRDCLLVGLDPERHVCRVLKSFYSWATADAGLTLFEHIPVLTLATAVRDESVTNVVSRAVSQLAKLRNRYRALWLDEEHGNDHMQYYTHDLPTLYGVVIKYSTVSLFTYDARSDGEPKIRNFAVLDFRAKDQDVWHAFAVAILFIHARNYLTTLKEEGKLGPRVIKDDSDPDA